MMITSLYNRTISTLNWGGKWDARGADLDLPTVDGAPWSVSDSIEGDVPDSQMTFLHPAIVTDRATMY